MNKHLFDISQDGPRLILMKCCGPAFEKLIFLGVFIFMFGLAAWQMQIAQWNPLGWAAGIVALLAAAMFCIECKEFWQVLKGDYWTFDLEEAQLEHNGEVVADLSHVSEVTIAEDEDGLCHEIWITLRQGAPIVLEDDSQGRMEVLTATAQRIADFAGWKVVRESKRV